MNRIAYVTRIHAQRAVLLHILFWWGVIVNVMPARPLLNSLRESGEAPGGSSSPIAASSCPARSLRTVLAWS